MSTFKENMAKAKTDYEKLEVILSELGSMADSGGTAELNPTAAKFIIKMIKGLQLELCQVITMHSNCLTVMGCALIEMGNDNQEMAESWLFEHCDQCEAGQYEAMESAQEYHDLMRMPFPRTIAEHQENMVSHNAKYDELELKRDAMRNDQLSELSNAKC